MYVFLHQLVQKWYDKFQHTKACTFCNYFYYFFYLKFVFFEYKRQLDCLDETFNYRIDFL